MTELLKDALRILVVVPVYNNQNTLRKVVQDVLETELPLLVVNDGSTDGSEQTIADLSPNLINFSENKGKGAAIRAAADWAAARNFTHMITMDADGQHRAKDIPSFLKKIGENPLSIVLGNRDFSMTDTPGTSQFGRKFSNFWVKISSGISVSDSQSGFRAYPVAALRKIKCLAKRYNYEVEILVRSIWAGLTVQSVDIAVHYNEQTIAASHFRPVVDNARISLTYSLLVIRNFIPLPHKIMFGKSHQQRMKFFLFNPFKTLKMLVTEKTSARQIGYAAALGIFLGTLPLIAMHSVAIIFFATRLKLNRLIALNVSHLCAPPFVPAIAIEIGYFLRHGHFLTEFTMQTLGHEALQRLGEYLIGATILAFPLSIIAGLSAYLIASIYRRLNRKPEKMKEANHIA